MIDKSIRVFLIAGIIVISATMILVVDGGMVQ